MRLLLCFIMPPLAVLLMGKPVKALLTIGLCVLAWIPGVIFALMVYSETKADARNNKMIAAMQATR